MSHLRPCSSCSRHVRADETRCPFCEATLAIDTNPPPVPSKRLGRAARMAFGAAVTTGAIVACGGGQPAKDASNTGAGASSSSASATTTATTTATETPPDIAKPYGAPPAEGLDFLV